MQSLSDVLEPFEDCEQLSNGSQQSYSAAAHLSGIKIQNLKSIKGSRARKGNISLT